MNKYRLSTLYFILLREGFYPLLSNNDFIGRIHGILLVSRPLYTLYIVP